LSKEKVLVFPENKMDGFQEDILPGITTSYKALQYFKYEIVPVAYYIDREVAEESPEFKQIIPYVVMKYKNRYLVYKRTKKGGEGRLHEKHSIGIGGHINPVDGDREAIENAIVREITEEVDFPIVDKKLFKIKPIGLIYDDSNDVGRVHFGFVWMIEFDKTVTQLPTPAEDAVAEFDWLPKTKIKKVPNLENWSKLVLKVL
jgi:predicted NUDIX family phosphoesterase